MPSNNFRVIQVSEEDVNSFIHSYHAHSGGSHGAKLPPKFLKINPDFKRSLAHGDHHARSFHQVRSEHGNKKNMANVVVLTGTYGQSLQNRLSFEEAAVGENNPDEFQFARLDDTHYNTPQLRQDGTVWTDEDGTVRTRSKMPYSTCWVIAGREVDLQDASKFLVSCGAPYDKPENIKDLCGKNSGGGKGNGKGRGHGQVRRAAPY